MYTTNLEKIKSGKTDEQVSKPSQEMEAVKEDDYKMYLWYFHQHAQLFYVLLPEPNTPFRLNTKASVIINTAEKLYTYYRGGKLNLDFT